MSLFENKSDSEATRTLDLLLFRQSTKMGVKGTSQAYILGNGRKHFRVQIWAMFCRIFNIEAGVLNGVDLREILLFQEKILKTDELSAFFI
ncbi:MAG: hypothetical protein IPP71_18325 [Bacteroidetes bacterium]|nr:hypothetical protein [Bacteroidota bacterium]